MTDARSVYDESNDVWPFFLLALLGVVLTPPTVSQLVQLLKSQSSSKRSSVHRSFQKQRVQSLVFKSTKFWLLVLGWVAVAYLVAQIRDIKEGVGSHAGSGNWDPYEILKVSASASEREIKTAYRRLSLQFHPDKVKDAVKEEAEAIYVEITKAYRALTDEVTRENFAQYGHPDGPQPVTHGIALPAFLFSATATSVVTITYLLGFGAGVPMLVAYLWTQSKQRTRNGLLRETAAQFAALMAKEQPHFLTTKKILEEVLSCADMDAALHKLTFAERQAALTRYLDRKTPQTNDELVLAATAVEVLSAVHDIAAAFGNFQLCRRIVDIRRSIIQAVPLGAKADESKRLPTIKLYDTTFSMIGVEKAVYANSNVHLELKFAVVPLGDAAPKPSREELDEASVDDAGSPEKHNASRPPLPTAAAPFFPLDEATSWKIYLYGDKDNKLLEKPYELKNMNLRNLQLAPKQIANDEGVYYDTIVFPMSKPTPGEPGIAPLRIALLNTTYFGCDAYAPAVLKVEPVPPEPFDDAEIDDSSDEENVGLSDIDTSTDEDEEEDEKEKKSN